ncbi:hypothetical protein BDZ89DRAFT_1080121 [Hymenopellis radicata]|nr:hypothetical protein BDZ89DRAFT_1080121 [Hymenopellis radicata]
MLSASSEPRRFFALGSTPPPPRMIRGRTSSIRTSIHHSRESRTTPEAVNSQDAFQTSTPSCSTSYATSPSDDAFEEPPRRAPSYSNDNEDLATRSIHTALQRRQSRQPANRYDPLAVRPSHNLKNTTSSSPEPASPPESHSTKLLHLSESQSITRPPHLRKYSPPPPTSHMPLATTNKDTLALQERTAKRHGQRYLPYQLGKVDNRPSTLGMDEEQPPIRQHVRGPSPSSNDRKNVPIQIQAKSGNRLKAVRLVVLKEKGIANCKDCIAAPSACPLSKAELNEELDPHPPSVSFTAQERSAGKRILLHGKVDPRTTVGGARHSEVDLSGVRVLDILANRDVILDGDKVIDLPDEEITVKLGNKSIQLRLQCFDCRRTVYGVAYAVSVLLHEQIKAKKIKGHIRNAFLVSLDLSETGVWEPNFSLY